MDVVHDGSYAGGDHVAHPKRSHTEGGNGQDEADDGEAFVPRGIGQLEVMLVGAGAVEYLSDYTQNVDGGDDDTAACGDGEHAVERIGILEGTYEDGHLSNETRETGQTEVGQTGQNVAHGEEGHDAHQAVQLADVAGMGTAVNHTDQGKEEGRHEAVAQHLQHGTRAGSLVEHQDGEQHEAAVRHGAVGVDVLEVGLHAGRESTVNHGDACEDKEYPAQLVGGFGHEVHGNAEAAVTSQLHEHAGVEHGYGGRRGGVTVGAPGVEGEEGTEHTETDEGQGEPDVLLSEVNGMGTARVVGYLDDVHRLSAGTVEDAENAAHEEGGTAHEHQGELHGGVFLLAAAPYADEEVHGDEGDFVEHEHGEHVNGNEEAEHTEAEQGEPKEVFLGEGLELPGGKGAGEHDDGGEQQHGHADTVDTYRILDVKRFEPVERGGVEHLVGSSCRTVAQEGNGQIPGQHEQGGTAGYHHRTHSLHIAGQPQSKQHDQGYENK